MYAGHVPRGPTAHTSSMSGGTPDRFYQFQHQCLSIWKSNLDNLSRKPARIQHRPWPEAGHLYARMEPAPAQDEKLINIVVHLDTLCPWCYIQKRSLDAVMSRYKAAHHEVEFKVIYKPFILHPNLDKGYDKLSLYEKKVGADKLPDFLSRIDAAGASHGIRFSFDGRTGPSLASHLLITLILQRCGPVAQARVLDRLYAGHFEFGRDITDQEWLVELGRVEGLDPDEVRAVLTSEQAAWLVRREVAAARTEYGVAAVPSVTVQGRYRVGGFQEATVFEDLFERVRSNANQVA
ncbi:hypothetical protein HJFPF1_08955 [Paramyrothecium foliicola]|nr:hypothetical protein HJFPF1_08955 [Paramyrothecium foliicola]